MLQKIARNLVDVYRLRKVMRSTRTRAAMRYHRWAREDVENLDSDQTGLIIEMGRLHRSGSIQPSSHKVEANDAVRTVN